MLTLRLLDAVDFGEGRLEAGDLIEIDDENEVETKRGARLLDLGVADIVKETTTVKEKAKKK